MFAYRVRRVYTGLNFLKTPSGYFIGKNILTSSFPTWQEAKKLWRDLGWDGSSQTLHGDAMVNFFTVPGPDGINVGFLIQDNVGQTYIASSVELHALRDSLDFDAHTDSEIVKRAVKTILNEDGEEVFGREMISWTRSKKGNMTTLHNGVAITVFPDQRDGGYKCVVTLVNERKAWLPRKRTEIEAVRHVTDNFRSICEDIQRAGRNRFAEWPDADDDPEA